MQAKVAYTGIVGEPATWASHLPTEKKVTLTASLRTNDAFANNACALMLWFWLDLLCSPRQLAGLDGACRRVREGGGHSFPQPSLVSL